MIDVLKHPAFARLFSAQVVALLGTGLLTVALALLAFDLAGDEAGAVLGTAFTIKMIAYIGLAPIANAAVERVSRKAVLIGADLVRVAVALLMPFIDAVWQIYVLIFILQAASAVFTPAFQAVIPDVLSDEKDYTKALSLSRLAYDLENLISPALAGLLLALVSYHWLFGGTAIGFAASAILVSLSAIPARRPERKIRSFKERVTRGTRIYLATPRLRGLLALNLAAASVGAFVIVNTVVIVMGNDDLTQTHVAFALAAFGAGSMVAALALPRLLEAISDRTLMIAAAFLLGALALPSSLFLPPTGTLGALLLAWGLFGLFYSAVLTPAGRLLRHSARAEDRPALFTAQFALSHCCWLLTYPIAGWAGEVIGLSPTLAVLGLLALVASAVALMVWSPESTAELVHDHDDLPSDHPHLRQFASSGKRHSHVFVIDDEHRAWPTQG
ncbi:MAG: MFS transporter [Alphaproteobacteria bacterium]|nr:MFS transporter [Alphaproteobacteria bacterium]